MKKKDKEKHLDNGKPDERENFDATDNKEVKPDGETRDEPEEKEDRDELNEKYLRLYSEFENYRKRNARER
ncbi:MAG: nucleotide exchange factor GrpE, partial [Flavobacteriales bacterium]